MTTTEKEFLHQVSHSLDSALLIVNRLIEEFKEEEGRLEDDLKIECQFNHLQENLEYLVRATKAREQRLEKDSEFISI